MGTLMLAFCHLPFFQNISFLSFDSCSNSCIDLYFLSLSLAFLIIIIFWKWDMESDDSWVRERSEGELKGWFPWYQSQELDETSVLEVLRVDVWGARGWEEGCKSLPFLSIFTDTVSSGHPTYTLDQNNSCLTRELETPGLNFSLFCLAQQWKS